MINTFQLVQVKMRYSYKTTDIICICMAQVHVLLLNFNTLCWNNNIIILQQPSNQHARSNITSQSTQTISTWRWTTNGTGELTWRRWRRSEGAWPCSSSPRASAATTETTSANQTESKSNAKQQQPPRERNEMGDEQGVGSGHECVNAWMVLQINFKASSKHV
mgnify:CR=1 FL=1